MAITSIKDADAALSPIEKSLRSEMESINRGLADWEHTQILIGEKDFIIRGLSKMDERRSVFEQELAEMKKNQDIKAINELKSRKVKLEAVLVRLGQLKRLIHGDLPRLKLSADQMQAEVVLAQQTADRMKRQYEQLLASVEGGLDALFALTDIPQVSAEPVKVVEDRQELSGPGSFVRNLLDRVV